MRIDKTVWAALSALVPGLVLAFCAQAASAEVALVVSSKSSINALRMEQASDIFLGKAGGEIVPLDLPESSPVREEFYAKATGKSPALLKAYWSKLIFTGKGQPPREAANSDAMKKLIADHPNFIGYIDSKAVDDSVKVVLVLK